MILLPNCNRMKSTRQEVNMCNHIPVAEETRYHNGRELVEEVKYYCELCGEEIEREEDTDEIPF